MSERLKSSTSENSDWLNQWNEIADRKSERLESNTSENSDWLDQWNELADRKRIDKFKENAAQELIERELNSELTKIDDLINAANANEDGISSKKLNFNYSDGSEKEVSLIILEGYPLKTLQSGISFYNTITQAKNKEDDEGPHHTLKTLQNDPSFWMKKQSEVEGLGDTTSATFCASYFDTNFGITGYTASGCCYAFDHVRPNSVVEISKIDGSSLPTPDIQQPKIGKSVDDFIVSTEPYRLKDINQKENPPYTLSELADMENPQPNDFNELVINRYDELGQPQKPDYILTRGNMDSSYGVDDLTIRHALYHNIPIVCIVPEKYKNVGEEHAKNKNLNLD